MSTLGLFLDTYAQQNKDFNRLRALASSLTDELKWLTDSLKERGYAALDSVDAKQRFERLCRAISELEKRL